MIRLILIVGSGGFIGTIFRFLSNEMMKKFITSNFPFGTLLVNIIGCLLIGVIFGLIDKGKLLEPELRLFLTTGICGGFTTFSAFSVENIIMLRNGDFFYVFAYLGLSILLGFTATYLGMISMNWFKV
jgi:CrcB protein